MQRYTQESGLYADSVIEYDAPASEDLTGDIELDVKGRNSRMPKRANHGARPCSSFMRKIKRKRWFNKIRKE